MTHFFALTVVVTGLLGAFPARAHDTWLSPASSPSRTGEAGFELSTGARYPLQETGSTLESLQQSACWNGAGRLLAMKPDQVTAKRLTFRVRLPRGHASPLSCWTELKPYEIELQPRLIPVYLDEIRASTALRDTWAALAARQLPWRESFRKFARIEAQEQIPVTQAQRAAARRPAGMALEIVLLSDGPVAVGEELQFQVLRDGRPLAGFQVELVSERSPLGVWRQTDTEGKLVYQLPFAGRWLLHGTDLHISPQDATRWESRFVTLALETVGSPGIRP